MVVYKIDRLSRSLTDFSKLVEVFDRSGVTFVSVTQSFNTTTSMGRLTLNILLSFAQFEREVTAERIRDKIAASKVRLIRHARDRRRDATRGPEVAAANCHRLNAKRRRRPGYGHTREDSASPRPRFSDNPWNLRHNCDPGDTVSGPSCVWLRREDSNLRYTFQKPLPHPQPLLDFASPQSVSVGGPALPGPAPGRRDRRAQEDHQAA